MRYIIYGAGAVGGTIGGRLHQAGIDVVLVARGAHYEALAARGLELRSPEGTVVLPLASARGPEAIDFGPSDVVILSMKTQDTAAALDALTAAAGPGIPVVCAQNGVENERLALRRFPRVYGICVMLPASHLEPGVVVASSAPVPGILDIGRYPKGSDDIALQVAADLQRAGFSSNAVEDIMRSKYSKLLMNLGNALEAACGRGARGSELYPRARAEAVECLHAAGIEFASEQEDRARRDDLLRIEPVAGERRGGGSSWQSLARETGSIEADYLNGEIVLLGRLHGIVTPVNALLQTVANEMARDRLAPGSFSVDDLLARLG